MLREHLSQEHDAASRRAALIDGHVAWIHHDLLERRPSRILDLGCGPGLYSSRLAALGHRCTGIDFSPASIEYAQKEAGERGLACSYELQDLAAGGFGEGYDLALFVFGELNAFPRPTARKIVGEAGSALRTGGRIVLEVSGYEQLEEAGRRLEQWYVATSGLFSDSPHAVLRESRWDRARAEAIDRYFVVDVATAEVSVYGQTQCAYSDAELDALLAEAGFDDVCRYGSLVGEPLPAAEGLTTLVARRAR